ncbi:MAG TPA: protease, partial [Acidobacteriota bacterium]|nr:protease [Acidobacteriota bacterium]
MRTQSGFGEVKKIDLGQPPSFFYNPLWSPDSKKVAYTDKRLNIWYVDIEKAVPVKVDSVSRGGGIGLQWSPDSRWLVYQKPVASWYRAIFVYSLEEAKSRQITDGMSDAGHPVFDKNGKYLYFSASTDIGPRVFGFDMSSYPIRPSRSVYLVVLKKDAPSPLGPESDEEKVQEDANNKGDKKKDQQADGNAEEKTADKKPEKKEPPKVEIDFENIGQRILALPVSARNVVELAAVKSNLLFIAELPSEQSGPEPSAVIHKFDLEKRKLDKFVDGVSAFDVSANGEKILLRQGGKWLIASTTEPFKPNSKVLKVEDAEVYVDPRAEWEQMYREVWRIERDFFYDPNHHGLDLEAMAARYRPFLDTAVHRAELNYLFQEMLGELSVGHLYPGFLTTRALSGQIDHFVG